MNSFSIIKAREEDMPRILEIEREAITPPWTHGALLGEIYRGDSYFALACGDGEALGFCILRRILDEGELFQIAVAGAARRRGVADALMAAALQCAEENGLRKVYLEVRRSNEPAISLYKKHGFTPAGSRKNYYDSPVEDALIMIREM